MKKPRRVRQRGFSRTGKQGHWELREGESSPSAVGNAVCGFKFPRSWRLGAEQQVRQLGDVHRDSSRLVTGKEMRGLPVVPAHNIGGYIELHGSLKSSACFMQWQFE